MSEVIDYIDRQCKECKSIVVCDLRNCGCVFGTCEHCGSEFEDESKCDGKG